ncbi:hypothetical protein MUP77_06700 [Candidatus Bathyarchaeota archaeon]|nr:hypothetical protein [Candidatus Bathyarchaeota archaeon]
MDQEARLKSTIEVMRQQEENLVQRKQEEERRRVEDSHIIPLVQALIPPNWTIESVKKAVDAIRLIEALGPEHLEALSRLTAGKHLERVHEAKRQILEYYTLDLVEALWKNQ